MIDRDRISRTTIDHEGRHVSDLAIRFPASQLEPTVPDEIDKLADHMEAEFQKWANASGFYSDAEVEPFKSAARDTCVFLVTKVSAGRRDKRRMKKADRNALKMAAMRNAGVPEATIKQWASWTTWILSLGSWVAPPPWNIVIAAVLFAVERYLRGGT